MTPSWPPVRRWFGIRLQRDHQIRGDVVADRGARIPFEPDDRVFVFRVVGLQNLADVTLGPGYRVERVVHLAVLIVGADDARAA